LRCYYINLDSRADRRQSMERRFERASISAVRVGAVNDFDVTGNQRASYCNPSAFRWMTERELACSLSHIKVLQQFLSTDDRYAAIFEDDIVIAPGLQSFLDGLDRSESEFDLVRLEAHPNPVRLGSRAVATFAGSDLKRIHQVCFGSAGYVVARRTAEFILRNELLLYRTVDIALYGQGLALNRNFEVLHSVPAFVVQDFLVAGRESSASDIVGCRDQRFKVNRAASLCRMGGMLIDFFAVKLPTILRSLRLTLAGEVKSVQVPIIFPAEEGGVSAIGWADGNKGIPLNHA
jgi:glycosyl transferase family 25